MKIITQETDIRERYFVENIIQENTFQGIILWKDITWEN